MTARQPTAPTSRWVLLALAVLLAASFALRAWYGAADPTSRRVFDERYSFHNVTALWLHDRDQPANAYYPGLSFLPQTALLWTAEQLSRATGRPEWSPLGGEGQRWSPVAYKLVRWLSALYGVLAVYWIFRIGRRLFDPWVGLWAAVFLAAVPHHLVSSGMFKPDILVVWLTLVTFEWSLRAVETPSKGRFALAGMGVGMAVAAKYTGVGAAIPLVAGAWWERDETGRSGIRSLPTWGLLLLAGIASLVAFLVFNPWIATTLSYLPELLTIYQTKGGEAGGTHLQMLVEEAGFLIRHHGFVVTALAVAGMAVQGLRARYRLYGSGPVMAVALVLGYSLLYAAATTLFKGQNYLPVAPFTALFAAWALVEGVRWLCAVVGDRLRRPAWPLLVTVAAAALLVSLYLPLSQRAYEEVVPTTTQQAAALLAARLRPVEERLVAYEAPEPLWVRSGGARAAMEPLDRLPSRPPSFLAAADAEVFPAARLDADDPIGSAGYLRRMAAGGGARVVRIEPRWAESRGEPLVILEHPWTRTADDEIRFEITAAPGRSAALRAGFPPRPESRWVSLALVLPRLDRLPERPPEFLSDGRPAVRVGERLLPLYLTQGRGRRGTYLTPRFELPAGTGRLEVDFGPLPAGAGGPRGRLLTWTPPSSPAGR